jgi:hypothetical protein
MNDDERFRIVVQDMEVFQRAHIPSNLNAARNYIDDLVSSGEIHVPHKEVSTHGNLVLRGNGDWEENI